MREETVIIESQALRDNYLNDDSRREIVVFRPEEERPGMPLFLELAGTNWNPRTHGKFERIVRKIIDEMKINAVIANPNFTTKYLVNQYLDSPAVGNYESFRIKELIPTLREKYGTSYTVLFWKSSGGFGAYSLAVRHPDVIDAFADHYGDSCFYYLYMNDFLSTFRALKGMKPAEKLRQILQNGITDNDMPILNVFASSAFYSPNLETECSFDMPIDPCDGSIVESVWEKWLKFDPARNNDKYRESLKRMKAVYLDVGIHDEYNLFIGMRKLHRDLERMHIDHFYEEFNGGHFGNADRYLKSLPYLYRKVTEERSDV